ncbi:MAG: ABC transporter ATP-binding protein [Pirellulaceae bacterium]
MNDPNSNPHEGSSHRHAGPAEQSSQAPPVNPETVLAHCAPDLDSTLRFQSRQLLLTTDRLLEWTTPFAILPATHSSWEDPDPRAPTPGAPERQWDLKDLDELALRECGSVGLLEIFSQGKRTAVWYLSADQWPDARQLVAAWQAWHSDGQSDRATESDGEELTEVCPSCGGGMAAGQSICDGCAARPAPPPSQSLWRLMRFAKPHARSILAGFLLTLASTAAAMIPPYLTMPLLDEVLVPFQAGKDVSFWRVPSYLAGLLLAAILAWLLSWAKTYVLAKVGETISADLRNVTYSHLQKLSLEFFGGRRTGDLIARVSDDTQRICDFLSMQLIDFATDVVMIGLTAVLLFWIHPGLALATLIPFPLIAWLIQRVRQKLRHGFARGVAAWAEMVNVLADTIPGIRVVKAFAQEHREVERFASKNRQVLDANNRVNRLWAAFVPVIALLTDIGVLFIWGFGAWLVAKGQITVGVLTVFITYIGRLYARLDSMSRMLAGTQRAAASTHRIFEILDRFPSVPEPVKPIRPQKLEGSIAIRNLHFRYGAREVLHGIDLKIQAGEMIGQVGPSGSGKSTLVNLVCRFYDPQSGSIAVDGIDIRSMPVSHYRSHIGIVLQEPFLFFGTIAENIAYGRPEASRREIIEAAQAAKAHDFILRLPDGYDSMVGERGQSLSGGERQRISIARALLTDPRILILDEATSAVDTQTEREIQGALDFLAQGRTTIAIAHRLSTLRKANRIIVLEAGRITEQGSHQELLELGGTYTRLCQEQHTLQPDASDPQDAPT